MGLRDTVKRRAKETVRRVAQVIVGHDDRPSTIPAVKPTLVAAQPIHLPAEPPAVVEGGLRDKLELATRGDTATDTEKSAIKDLAIASLKTIFDPEIPVNIWDLGLVYGVDVGDDRTVAVKMTLTAPNCPAAQSLPAEVQRKAGGVDGALGASVDIVWDPPWTPEKMSEAARLELNIG